jgi:hypothetical protein
VPPIIRTRITKSESPFADASLTQFSVAKIMKGYFLIAELTRSISWRQQPVLRLPE